MYNEYGSQQFVSVVNYGASPNCTLAENKTALQNAILDIDSRGRGVIVIPPDINYGYKRNILSTHPDFSNTKNDILIIDFSLNNQYNTVDGDGMQLRYHSKTKDENDGSHDGNTFWFDGAWHPAIMLNHTGKDANNRRNSIFFLNDGVATWAIGQGINTAGVSEGVPVDATDDELSHFKIAGNKIAGGAGLETMLAINKVNGYWGFGGMQQPDVEYHFRTKRGTKGRFKVESHASNMEITLATPTKARNITVRDDNGTLNITNSALTSNVVTVEDDGNVIARGGMSVAVTTLPTNPVAGRIVFHGGTFKGFNGTSWVTL